MNEQDRSIARELKQQLSAIAQIIDFKVFGSRARGDAVQYSDMDVFIEVETMSHELKDRISDIVWEVGFKHDVVIVPLIFTRQELENSPLRSSPIVKNIAKEGVAV